MKTERHDEGELTSRENTSEKKQKWTDSTVRKVRGTQDEEDDDDDDDEEMLMLLKMIALFRTT